jgi:UDP-4-amino-4,6-dideoxy-N-acetyl-beta-L-altrosamine transaminase
VTIPYGRQDIRNDDVAAVEAVLRSDYLTQGPAVPAFEDALAAYTGARHAIAVSNATSALHIACLALGVGPGDEVWTSPNTFVASANCALYCGANAAFVDVEPDSYNLCPQALENKLKASAASGKKPPKIVIAVAFAGQSPRMDRIRALANEYGFSIIEDASHAIGGQYQGQRIGGGDHADITIFSFHPVKIITTAEGGMALTNRDDLAAQMRLLRSHGITRDAGLLQGESHGPWYYEQIDLGYNFRMTDMQAALGRSQVARIDEYVERRHAIAARYERALGQQPISLPAQSSDGRSALHLYPIHVTDTARRLAVFQHMRKHEIMVNVHYIPVYLQPFYRARGHQPGECPVAEQYYAGAISLPMFPTLTESDQDFVIEKLIEALQR